MYIRTKDGIYEVDKNSKGNEDFLWVKTKEANIVQLVWLNCIINQSENLVELIDEFVVTRDGTKTKQLVRTDNIEYLKEMMKEDKRIIEVKGAVWTDKGLKYVAKLDDKGTWY